MLIGSFAGELGAANRTSVLQLQTNLATLGKIVRDSTLANVRVDGSLGAKTVAAVYLAFSKYVLVAPAAFKKKMTVAGINTNLSTLTPTLAMEIARRGGVAVPASTVIKAKAAKKVAPKLALAKKHAVKKVKALTKVKAAQAKRQTLKTKAVAQRRAAQSLRAKAKTATSQAAAAAAEQQADLLEKQAGVAEQAAASADQEAASAAVEATQAAAQESAVTKEVLATEAATPADAAVSPDAGPTVSTEALSPGGGEETAGESFFAKYKLPIIGVGVLAAVGAALAFRKRTPHG